MYHLVFPLNYRKSVINEQIAQGLKEICFAISERYEVHFIEIGYESNHVHFLVQSVPNYSVSKRVRMLKSITAKELFNRYPEIKAKLWGGKYWTSDFYANTVGQYFNESVIKEYVKNQGMQKQYKKIHTNQLKLF